MWKDVSLHRFLMQVKFATWMCENYCWMITAWLSFWNLCLLLLI